jgi:hypothetical protein
MNDRLSREALVSALRTTVAAAAALLASSAALAPAHAQKKPLPACGITGIPFAVGNEWTYEAVASSVAIPEGALARIPKQPSKVVIKVTGIETVNAQTTILLDEKITTKIDEKTSVDRTVQTKLSCAADHLDIDPQSYFFAGEPGGGLQIELTDVKRTGTTLPIKAGFLAGPTWIESLVGKFKAKSVEGTNAPTVEGEFDFERQWGVGQVESVTTALGSFQGPRLMVELVGQLKLASAPDKPYDIQANLRSALWFAKGVGVIQTLNNYGHQYQLTATNVIAAPAAPGAAAAKPAK